MARLELRMIFMLWAGLAVLSSATYLTLTNAQTRECVTIDEAFLCVCVESNNFFSSNFHKYNGDGCQPNTQASLDVHGGYIFVYSGFPKSETEKESFPDHSGKLLFPQELKEMRFDFRTNCLTHGDGININVGGKDQCLPDKQPFLKQLNPYFHDENSESSQMLTIPKSQSYNSQPGEQKASLPLSNIGTDQSDPSTPQPPSTDPNTLVSTNSNNEEVGNTQTIPDNTAEILPTEGYGTGVNQGDEDLVNSAPLPSRRRRRTINARSNAFKRGFTRAQLWEEMKLARGG